mmetsp:Transcript_38350/g.108399  ORF Transcript_38350/g.108399 Transcript_38350/m.108399 type:complete len:139 (-) Transcript_38350:254-670(-)|eukprot:CAMPEP_0117656854 /NCGR_PEP_ID=MMETSP0804-20121206/5023_1 /TAXON_ID=1074897 /ORGANISM="Tetraselmis astigmatica, Strain CCMP880" /LENGTH=138 /DNA_ID=CAMNT_0005463277 /DNA_START=96 /DNA_END=512 /DNA_ORIENTATION=+
MEPAGASKDSVAFGNATEEWMKRKSEGLCNPYGIMETTNFTYGKFWGQDGGLEASQRMRKSEKGFAEGWYGTATHITPEGGMKTKSVEAHLPLERDDPVTRKHLFGKDHWFMGAKYPNWDTMSQEVKDTYYTIPLDTE